MSESSSTSRWIAAALFAIAIRPAPRFKLSLRDLLTLTTVAAPTVGPLAFWLRRLGKAHDQCLEIRADLVNGFAPCRHCPLHIEEIR